MPFHVRRKDREITDADALKKILKSTKYVFIALCMSNEPYLVSLSHGYDEAANSQIKPEKLVKTTMGRIDLDYMSSKRHQNPKLGEPPIKAPAVP
jgi:hypothetical protein